MFKCVVFDWDLNIFWGVIVEVRKLVSEDLYMFIERVDLKLGWGISLFEWD